MFKSGAIANLFVLIGPAIIGGILVILLPATRNINPTSEFFILGSILLAIGWGFLAYSKWPQIKSGQFFKFGPSSSSKTDKRNYVISYLILILGFILVFSSR